MVRFSLSLARAKKRREPAEPKPVGTMVSFPKSGRTWLRVMLDEFGVHLRYTHDGARHSKPIRFEEMELCGQRFQRRPVIFLSRDPRDTAVSGYFQKSRRRDGYDGTLSDFIRDPLHGVEKVVRYNLTWLERGAKLPAFLPITYEAMSRNTIEVVARATEFLALDIRSEVLEEAVANSTFEKMHARESRAESREDYLAAGDISDPESYKVRRGKVGGFLDYLPEDDVAYCEVILDKYRYSEASEKAHQ